MYNCALNTLNFFSATDPAYVRMESHKYCTPENKCFAGEGVCSWHSDWEGDLKCGWANCKHIRSDHKTGKTVQNRCCYQPPQALRKSIIIYLFVQKFTKSLCIMTG